MDRVTAGHGQHGEQLAQLWRRGAGERLRVTDDIGRAEHPHLHVHGRTLRLMSVLHQGLQRSAVVEGDASTRP